MAISPSTDLRIIKCPLELDEKNQITFSSATAQANYFLSLPHLEIENISYQRKDSTIRFPGHIDSIIEYNYVMYKNDNYSNKWFYAFITNMEYINDNMTLITIKTDVFQTWQFDLTWKQSFIEREMINLADDIPGKNVIEEDLNVGELICDREQTGNEIGAESNYWFVVSCNYDPSDRTRYAGVALYGDYPQGSIWFAFLVTRGSTTAFETITQWLHSVTTQGHTDDVFQCFALPYQAFSNSDVDANTHMVKSGRGTKLNVTKDFVKSTYRAFTDYPNVKNQKLLTYPYSFIRITNNMGNYNDYKIEDFHVPGVEPTDPELDKIRFNIIGVPCLGYSGKVRPKYYKGIIDNEDEAVQLGKYPTLSFNSDAFTNWLTQNAVNLVADTISNVASIGVGIATLPAGGGIGITKGASGMANTIGSIYKSSMAPNTPKGNANSGDVSFSQNLLRFKYMHMRPKAEILKTIDDFFSMFGYKTNEVKMPNLNNRKYWNYVKTIDCNILADIPQNDLQEIKSMFDTGVTLWHTTTYFLDYSQNNNASLT